MKQRKEFTWWEPSWSFRPKLAKAFQPARNPWFWVRIELAGVVFIGFAFWLSKRFPDLELPLGRLIPAALAVPLVVAGAPLLLFWWMPPFIAVTRKGVMVMQGQHANWYLAKQIQAVQLLLHVPERPLLRVSTDAKSGTYGIALKVNLADLETFIREALPEAKCERLTV